MRLGGATIALSFGASYPPQRTGASYGRIHYLPSAVGYFDQPTPGRENQSEGAGFAPIVRFSQAGGLFTDDLSLGLSTTNANATIYFTTDGSDPRSLGDQPSPLAKIYTTPVMLDESASITARVQMANPVQRVLGGGPLIKSYWSGPSRFHRSQSVPPAAGDLVISELHFDPPSPVPAESAAIPGVSGDDFEFVELRNISRRSLDLFGVRFTEGLQFVFTNNPAGGLAPGRTVVVARNATALRLRHDGLDSREIAGSYSERLANGGEIVRLADGLGRTLIDLSWDGGWQLSARGEGSGLLTSWKSASTLPVITTLRSLTPCQGARPTWLPTNLMNPRE